MGQPNPGSSSQGGQHSRLKTWTEALAFATAFLILLTTVLGILFKKESQKNDNLSDARKSASSDLNDARSSIKAAQSSLASIHAYLSGLPTGTTTTVTRTVTVTSGGLPVDPGKSIGAGKIYHAGTLLVRSGTAVADLDALPSDVLWGRNASVAISDADIGEYSGGYLHVSSNRLSDAKIGRYTFQECQSDQGLEHVYDYKIDIRSGLCIVTDADHIATISIQSIDSKQVILQIVVYSK